MEQTSSPLRQPAQLLLRFGLGTAFLSAVADRLGLWGPPGAPRVAWGDFEHFTAYTRAITWFTPAALTSLFAWGATAAEALFGVLLLLGFRTREIALASSALLVSFAACMSISGPGIHGAFAYSVFTAAGGALLLSTVPDPAWSLDAISKRQSP